MTLLSVAEAHARLMRLFDPLEAEEVPLARAAGRVLARDVVAKRAQPPFPASAMDGYAMHSADAVTGREPPCRRGLRGGGALRGPDRTRRGGAHLHRRPGAPRRRHDPDPGGRRGLRRPDHPARRPRPRRPHPPRRRRLRRRRARRRPAPAAGPSTSRLLAAMNAGRVAVHRRPVVALIPTGDELVMPGEDPGPDQIVSSNGIGLKAMLEAVGRRGPPPAHRPRHAGKPRRLLRAGRRCGPDRDARRRVGRRLRPGAEDGPRPRHGPRLLPGGHAPGKAADGGPARWHSLDRAARQPGLRHGHRPALSHRRRRADAGPARGFARHAFGPARACHWGRTARAPTTCGRGSSPARAAGSARRSTRQDSSLLSVLAEANALMLRPPHDPALEPRDKVEFLWL